MSKSSLLHTLAGDRTTGVNAELIMSIRNSIRSGGVGPRASVARGTTHETKGFKKARRRAYRAVYSVRFEKAVYVLHAFQNKSPSGIRTAKRDVDLIAERLKTAERDHQEHYGKPKR
jgi:phage-related protein